MHLQRDQLYNTLLRLHFNQDEVCALDLGVASSTPQSLELSKLMSLFILALGTAVVVVATAVIERCSAGR